MKRTKLSDRVLTNYSRGEELMNTVTHIVGGALGVAALTLCVVFAALRHNVYGVVGSAIYGVSLIALYTVSSVYHGLKPGIGKKVMQIVDHCTIYFLIAGTYTVIVLSAIRCHTTGKVGMLPLDMIVFLSDKIEPSRRPYPELEKLRELASKDLAAAMLHSLQSTLDYVRSQNTEPHPLTRQVADWLQRIV